MKNGNQLFYRGFARLCAYVCCFQVVMLAQAVTYTNVTWILHVTGYPSPCSGGSSGPDVWFGSGFATPPGSFNWNSGTYTLNPGIQAPASIDSSTAVWAFTDNAGSGCNHTPRVDGTHYFASGNNMTVDIYFDWIDGPAAPVVTNTFRVCSATTVGHTICNWFYNDATGALVGQNTLPPGQTVCFEYTTTGSGNTPTIRQMTGECDLGPSAAYNNGTNSYWNPATGQFNGNGYTSGSGTNNELTGGAFVTPPGKAFSTNLGFSGASGSAKDSTLQEGFSALRDELVNDYNGSAARQGQLLSTAQAQLTVANASDAKLSTLNTTATGIKSDTAGIKTDTAAISTGIGNISSKATSIDTSLGDIRTLDTARNTKLDTLNTSVGAVGTTATAIKTSTDAVKTSVDAVNSAMVHNNTALDQIAAYMTYSEDNHTFLGRLDTKATAANASLDGIYNQLVAANGHVDGLEGLLGTIDGDLDTLNATSLQIRDGVYGITNGMDNGAAIRGFTNRFKDLVPGAIDSRLTDQHNSGVSAFSDTKDLFDGTISGIATPSAAGVGNGDALTIHVAGFTFDCNPVTSTKFGPMCAALKVALTWCVTVLYCFAIWKCTQKHVLAGQLAQQTRAIQLDFFGNSIGTALGIPAAIAICVALAAIPAFGLAFLNSAAAGGSLFSGNPFTTIGGASGGSLYLAQSMIPLDTIVEDIALYFVYSISVTGVYAFATNLVRFVIG
jgi:hypothetical protein